MSGFIWYVFVWLIGISIKRQLKCASFIFLCPVCYEMAFWERQFSVLVRILLLFRLIIAVSSFFFLSFFYFCSSCAIEIIIFPKLLPLVSLFSFLLFFHMALLCKYFFYMLVDRSFNTRALSIYTKNSLHLCTHPATVNMADTRDGSAQLPL